MQHYAKVALKPVPVDQLFFSVAVVVNLIEEDYMHKLGTGCESFS